LSEAPGVARTWLVVALALSWIVPARAQAAPPAPAATATAPAEEAIRFQYTAPADCPDQASFAVEVRKRTALGRFAEPGELARTFTIKLTPDATGYWGSIELLDDTGMKVARHLHGEQCEAVVSSLALITALALDASLRHAEETAPPLADASASSNALPAEPPPHAVAVTPASALWAVTPPRRIFRRRGTGARVGVGGGYDSSIHALPFALLGQLDWRSGFALRFTARYATDEFVVDEGRRAVLRRVDLETSACPWRLAAGVWGLSPCAAFDLGTLRAEGVKAGRLTSASGKTIFWASVGAELRLAWEPDAPVWIELRGAAGFPLVSHQFRFKYPDASVLTVPRFSGAAGLVTGVRF
jgi:hypothetical protein